MTTGPLQVGCAVIRKAGKILIAQRCPGDTLSGYWEFPGGKRHVNETMEKCLEREIMEELGIAIRPSLFLRKEIHEYPSRVLELYFYLCDWLHGQPQKLGCHDFRWVFPEELKKFPMIPADIGLINELIQKKYVYFTVPAHYR